MFDGSAPAPAEPDWKAVALLAMNQRDKAVQKAANLEIDLELACRREAELLKRLAPSEPAPAESP